LPNTLLRAWLVLLIALAGGAHAAPNAEFAALSNQFLEAYWQAMPDAAIAAGKFDGAEVQPIPNRATRQRTIAFAQAWTRRLDQVDAAALPPGQRTDLALIKNELAAIRWNLTTFRSHEWNPSDYNTANGLDAILNTDYAPVEQRLRTIMQRLDGGPAYYRAARASIINPTREHTQLALTQLPGALTLLDALDKMAQGSALGAGEKRIFGQRVQQNRAAINTFMAELRVIDASLANGSARSFRIGRDLYDAKFNVEIQSGMTAAQTYQSALASKEQLLQRMQQLTDTLWPKYMGETAKPAGRAQQIKLLIDKMSENHIARGDLFAEVRKQIPLLEQWVTSHDLLTLDPARPLNVRETPTWQRGIAGASIDAPGPFQPQRATYYNVTPIDDETPEQAESFLREYNYWMLQILNIHEAVPGHYVQLIYANKSPSLIKTVLGNGAMIEGWAVYGERMMLESGYGGNTPEMWLMYSKWNLRSVCNTILDYSVHVLGMSEAEARNLLINDAFQTDNEATGKWRRVQLTSVQLTSYYSGFAEIMALREERKKALGAQFDLKKFHEEFLSYGAAPVKVIRSLMQ
jgi:uncharacterized protein (DUF885 family)